MFSTCLIIFGGRYILLVSLAANILDRKTLKIWQATNSTHKFGAENLRMRDNLTSPVSRDSMTYARLMVSRNIKSSIRYEKHQLWLIKQYYFT